MKKLLILSTIASTIIAMNPMYKTSAIIKCALHTMAIPPLNTIETDLVHAEIKRIGMPAMREKIEHIGFVYTDGYDDIQMTGLLEINSQFNREESERDPLAKTIFDTIDSIEKESGYMPAGTNYLGHNTRYFWQFVDGKHSTSIVHIKAMLDNRTALQKIVTNYKGE